MKPFITAAWINKVQTSLEESFEIRKFEKSTIGYTDSTHGHYLYFSDIEKTGFTIFTSSVALFCKEIQPSNRTVSIFLLCSWQWITFIRCFWLRVFSFHNISNLSIDWIIYDYAYHSDFLSPKNLIRPLTAQAIPVT